MRRNLSAVVVICLLFCLTAVSIEANTGVTIEKIDVFSEGVKVNTTPEGEIAPYLTVTNSGEPLEVMVTTAIYQGNDLEDICVAKGILESGTGKVLAPRVSVNEADGREVRVFMWNNSLKTLCKIGKILENNFSAGKLKSVTLVDGNNKSYEGIIDSKNKEVKFIFDTYTKESYRSGMPNINGAYIDTGNSAYALIGNVDFSKPMLLVDENTGDSFTVVHECRIVQKYVDFDDTTLNENKIPDGVGDEGRTAVYGKGFSDNTKFDFQITPRPLNGGNDEGIGSVIHVEDKAADASGYLLNHSDAGGGAFTKANRIVFEFDVRVDSMSGTNDEGHFNVGCGPYYQSNGAHHTLAFGLKAWNGATAPGPDQYNIGIVRGDGNTTVNGIGAGLLNMKQWYRVKQIINIDEPAQTYSTDVYIDNEYITTVEDNSKIPTNLIEGYYNSTQNPINNFRIQFFRAGVSDVYFDNIKLSYSYIPKNTALYMIGDGLMQETAAETPYSQQGWGAYFDDELDADKITVINTARSGHSAGLYTNNTGAVITKGYEADWHFIKSSLKSGDYVLVSIGVNDLSENNGNIAKLISSVKGMIQESEGYGANVIICSEPPSAGYQLNGAVYQPGFADYTDVSQALQTAAEECGSSVIYIPLGTVLVSRFKSEIGTPDDEGLLHTEGTVANKYYCGVSRNVNGAYDYTHLNTAGAKFVAKTAKELISKTSSGLVSYFTGTNIPSDTQAEKATLTIGDKQFNGLIKGDSIEFYTETYYTKTNDTIEKLYDDDFYANYSDNISAARITIQTSDASYNATVNLSSGADSFTITAGDASKTYDVVFEELNQQYSADMSGGFGITSTYSGGRSGMPHNIQGGKGYGQWNWTAGSKVDTTLLTFGNYSDGLNGKSLRIKKTDAATHSAININQCSPDKGVTTYVVSYSLKMEYIDESGLGAYIGFPSGKATSPIEAASTRQGLVFSRRDKSKIDGSFDLKYITSPRDSTPKDFTNHISLDMGEWYDVTTVYKNTMLSEGCYNTTLDIYIDNKYLATVSDDYTEDMGIKNHLLFGGYYGNNDNKTAYTMVIDNLKIMYNFTGNYIKK